MEKQSKKMETMEASIVQKTAEMVGNRITDELSKLVTNQFSNKFGEVTKQV